MTRTWWEATHKLLAERVADLDRHQGGVSRQLVEVPVRSAIRAALEEVEALLGQFDPEADDHG
jgi:hypothetical protein